MPRDMNPARFLVGIITTCCICMMAVVTTSAATWHVSPTALRGLGASEQFRTISEAARAVKAGDTVLIYSGVYRETVSISASGTPKSHIRFEAAQGAHVIVTGADRVTEWTKEPGEPALYSTAWPYSFINWSPDHTHGGPAPVGRCEQVFVQAYPLQQVMWKDKLTFGTFFIDDAAKRLYVCPMHNGSPDDLDMVSVEASTRESIWQCSGAYVETRGIRFRYAANRAQQGAAVFTGVGDVIENCVFERTNGVGASFGGRNMIVRGCTFQDNGQMGFGVGNAHHLLFTGCTVRRNNSKGFDRGWEAGGDKIVLTRGAVIENSSFIENRGNGIWFDIGNENCTVRNCLIADNEDSGIFYEISYGLHAHDNVITGNGFSTTYGSWGSTAGISLSSSPGCTIERNLLIGNAEGFSFREQGRTTPRIDGKKEEPIWNHDSVIRNNLIAFNNTQVWGWFDVLDERHWPKKMQGNPKPEMSLESLRFVFKDNIYSPGEAGELFNWGCTWKRNKRYSSLEDVRKELSFEKGSRVEKAAFADPSAKDYRLPAGSVILKAGCYPRGSVPGVRLGTTH